MPPSTVWLDANWMRTDYPILEFDDSTEAIIEPSKVLKPVDGIPERCVCPSTTELPIRGVKMSPQADRILLEALKLSPLERAELVERLLTSFSFPDRTAVDERWAPEAEDRIDAYERGEVGSSPATEVFARISRGEI